MDAKDFLKNYGEPFDPNARFCKAGNTIVVPLVDLLEAYAGSKVKTAPVKAKTTKRK